MLNSRAHTGAPSSALLVFRGWQYTTANTHTLTHRTFEREREKTAGSYNFLGWRKAKFEIKGKTHQLHFGCCWGEQHRKLGGGWSLLLIIWYMNTLILHWGEGGQGGGGRERPLPPHRVNEIEEDFLANPITVTVETFKQLTLRQLRRKYNPESPEVEEKRGCTTEKKSLS